MCPKYYVPYLSLFAIVHSNQLDITFFLLDPSSYVKAKNGPDPEVVQGQRPSLRVLEHGHRLGIGTNQVLPPGLKWKFRRGSSSSHFPVVIFRQIQGIIHRAEEGIDQTLGVIRVLLSEVDPGHFAQAANGTAHRGHTQQAKLHVDVAEGFGTGRGKAKMCPAAQIFCEFKEPQGFA